MQHLHSTKAKHETPVSGEVITLPPVQVRRRPPAIARRINDLLQRIIPALLGLGLLAQMGTHWRDLAGARWPALSPVLEALCQCRLQAPRQLEALVVDNTTLKRPQESAGFQLGVTLRNKATHRIAAPHIELSLTDTRGQVVLRRVLSPQEFRQPDILQAQADATWLLDFSSTDSRITGYTLAAFYP